MTGANLFLVASPRSGSTQLFHWLGSHPDIWPSPIKEPNFFSAHEFDPSYVQRTHLNDCDPDTADLTRPAQFAVFRRAESYARLFQGAPQKWRLEGSTSYLVCPEAPAAIWSASPGAKVILLTRAPVDRALSHYRLALRTGRTRESLAAELAAEIQGDLPLAARYLLRPSRQQAGIDRFRATFGDDRVLHLRFDDLRLAPTAALMRIARFLDLDPCQFDTSSDRRNESAMPRFPIINAFLNRTGIKTTVRRVLPGFAKHQLRRLWFNPDQHPTIWPAELAALELALKGESH